MNPETRLLIDGQLVAAESGKQYDNISPTSEAVIGTVADAGAADMDRAIACLLYTSDAADERVRV